MSSAEIEPDVKGDLKLVDCEDADIAEITVSKPLLDRYQRTLAASLKGPATFARGAACTTCLRTRTFRLINLSPVTSAKGGCAMSWLRLSWDLLGPLQWAALLAIPPIIVLLYFLKLRREPMEVPSTYL